MSDERSPALGKGRSNGSWLPVTSTASFRHAMNTFLSSAFIHTAVWRLVKDLYLSLYQRLQREELNCLGCSTIAQYVKQDHLGPTLGFMPLYPVCLEIASYHCFIRVVGQEVWTTTQHFFNLSQPTLNLFCSHPRGHNTDNYFP